MADGAGNFRNTSIFLLIFSDCLVLGFGCGPVFFSTYTFLIFLGCR